MPSAILCGYYGHQNAGDDAFLVISGWGARKYWGCDELWAYADVLPHTYGVPVRRMLVSWTRRGGTRLNKCLEAWRIGASDTIVFGGGSIFHSTRLLEEYLRMLDRAPSGRHFAVGVSIGPFLDATASTLCVRVLERLAFVGVRDRPSVERVRGLAPDAPIALTLDLAPLLAEASGVATSFLESNPRRGLGIALRGYSRREEREQSREQERLEAVATALRECAKRGVLDEVVLIDMNADHECDWRVHQILAAHLDGRIGVRHHRYDGDASAAAHRIAGLRGLVAMRLHAAVFAYMGESPRGKPRGLRSGASLFRTGKAPLGPRARPRPHVTRCSA